MLFGEPTLGSERPAVIEVAWAATEGKVGEVNDDLAMIEALVHEQSRCASQYNAHIPLLVCSYRPLQHLGFHVE